MRQASGCAQAAARIDHAVAMADHVRARIEASDGAFATLAPGSFTNVVFVWVPPELRPFSPNLLTDDQTRRLHAVAPKIKARMQLDGRALLGYQPVNDLNCFRFLFMNSAVDPSDIDVTLADLERYGEQEWAAMEAVTA
jgi:glutamate decarboxylase